MGAVLHGRLHSSFIEAGGALWCQTGRRGMEKVRVGNKMTDPRTGAHVLSLFVLSPPLDFL